MTHETVCRECTGDITIHYAIDPGEPRTWMDPGYPAEAHVSRIEADCDCPQDEEGYDDELMEAAHDEKEAWEDSRADAALDRRDDR